MGEKAFGEGAVEYCRFYGMDVPYTQRSTFAFGGPVFVTAALVGTAISNSAARNNAQRMAVPQWRFDGYPHVVLTSSRMLIRNPSNYQWQSFSHSSVIEFGPAVQEYSLRLGYQEYPPVRLRGPFVPWLSVVLAACLYPREHVPGLPCFAPLSMYPP